MLHHVSTALACAALVACGGKAQRHDEVVPGPVYDGKALYDLRIERISDDCQPPYLYGAVGPLVVWVKTAEGPAGPIGTATIPAIATDYDPAFDPARTDVNLYAPTEWTRVLDGDCPTAAVKETYTVLSADSTGLEVDWTATLSGACNTPASCTSHRVYHFDWIRACANDSGNGDCP